MSPFSSRMKSEAQVDLSDFVTRRSLVDRDRLGGERPLSVETVGEQRFYWGATSEVAVGGSATLFLTMNGGVGGSGVFGKVPDVQVFRDLDVTRGGLARATGTLDPTKTMRLRRHDDYDLVWDGPNQVWTVVVTNNSAEATGFLVTARGLS
jgi:hypothetical protein